MGGGGKEPTANAVGRVGVSIPLLKGAEAAGDFEAVVRDRDAAVTDVVSFEGFV